MRHLDVDAPARAPTLRRALGLWQVSLARIGVILGAGVQSARPG